MLAIANERRIPVTPFGVGTSLEGHIIPVHGGISLDLSRLDRIVDISPANLTATVQAGVTRLALDARCRRARPLLPRRPRRRRDARRHGRDERRRHDDRSLRQDARQRARARGRARRRARHPHRHPGREVVRGLRPHRPARRLGGDARRDHRGDGAGSTRSPSTRSRCASRSPTSRAPAGRPPRSSPPARGVTRIEFLDAWFVAAANAYSGTSYPEGPCLFVEAAGSEELVNADLELVQAIAEEEGATEIVHERDPDARARLWKTRHDAAHAAAHHFPGTKERATDVCVPLTELAGAAQLRPRRDRPARPQRRHPRPRRRRQPPRRRAGEARRDRGVRGARAQHRRRRPRARRHLHGRARHRPRQDRRPRAGARRPDPADAGDQGELRPERDPQPRQGAAEQSAAPAR